MCNFSRIPHKQCSRPSVSQVPQAPATFFPRKTDPTLPTVGRMDENQLELDACNGRSRVRHAACRVGSRTVRSTEHEQSRHDHNGRTPPQFAMAAWCCAVRRDAAERGCSRGAGDSIGRPRQLTASSTRPQVPGSTAAGRLERLRLRRTASTSSSTKPARGRRPERCQRVAVAQCEALLAVGRNQRRRHGADVAAVLAGRHARARAMAVQALKLWTTARFDSAIARRSSWTTLPPGAIGRPAVRMLAFGASFWRIAPYRLDVDPTEPVELPNWPTPRDSIPFELDGRFRSRPTACDSRWSSSTPAPAHADDACDAARAAGVTSGMAARS